MKMKNQKYFYALLVLFCGWFTLDFPTFFVQKHCDRELFLFSLNS